MKKIRGMNEIAWLLGILICALGVALCTKADFGLSMIAAPAYILHVALRDIFPLFSQGTSEYVIQGLILVILCVIVRRFRGKYIFSFVTAVLFGFALDLWIFVFGGNGAYEELWQRIVAFAAGEITTAVAIAFFFRTTMPLQVYELTVCEIADKFGKDKNKVKLFFDITMFLLSGVMSLVLTGGFNGFGIGTIIIVIVNAPLITLFGKVLDKFFVFDSLFKISTEPNNDEKI